MAENFIGRKSELQVLQNCMESNESEFIAIYGRRRVGKTFLVRQTLEDHFIFYAEGILNEDTDVQLRNFNKEIVRYGGSALLPATNWIDAFENLNSLIENAETSSKKVIFLDEVSSMATAHSGFLSALAHFWNRWVSLRGDVLLIICESATSWIIKNIVGDKGGLHNRLTRQILLQPFTLKECEEFFQTQCIPLTRYQMAECYMILGGIPYYLKLMKRELSLPQNIDLLYFTQDAPLRNEYKFLYDSLFSNPDNHIKIIEALAKVGHGLTRGEIADKTGLAASGRLTKTLGELIDCGFVREYLAYGKKERDRLYQLIDPFTLFHLHFHDKRRVYSEDYWLHFYTTSAHATWSGYAFERVCLQHTAQIRKALGVSGVLTEVYSWRSKTSVPGAQIDLVIDRADRVVNLCEVKYSSTPFKITKAYAEKLREKRAAFLEETRKVKSAQTTLITTFGLVRNEYSNEILSQVQLDDLFL